MLYFHDFKGFAQAELDLFKPLTVLIGPNGSGKSNVIEGIELLSFIAQGYPLHEIGERGKSGRVLELRGGLQACPRNDREAFSFNFFSSINIVNSFFYRVKIQVKPNPQIIEESLSSKKLRFNDDTRIFQTVGQPSKTISADIIQVQYNNFAQGGRKPKVSVSNSRSVLSQYKEFAQKNNKKYVDFIRIIDKLLNDFRASFIFEPNPKLMRTYERIGNHILARDGANLSAVLYALQQGREEDQHTLHRLLDWIKQLPEEPYQKIEFVTTSLNDVIFGFRNENAFIDARLLSDGTLRTLAILTALETVDPQSRVVIEEFDNGLHPSRIEILLQAIASCGTRRKLNVLVTTHNPATLNALQPEQLDGVVCCVRDVEQQAFKLVRLCDLPQYVELLERGRLGDLVTRRVIEQYLTPEFEETRKAEALNWLRSLPWIE